MGAAFVVTLREGLEAALIVGIILAYLARSGNMRYFRNVWLGAGAAVMVSVAVGAGLFWTVGQFSGRAEEIFEGIAMLVAVLMLTYMIVWMKRRAADMKQHLEDRVVSALAAGSTLAVASLAFVVVVREGIETVLFMMGVLTSTTPVAATVGGLLGLGVALVIGYAGYKGAKWMNLAVFFNVTGVILIIFAAGLLAHGIHEFQEAGLFPVVIEHVWDTNGFLNEKEGVGSFMKAMFGYNGNPELVEVSLYFTYLAAALAFFFGATRVRGRRSLGTPAVSAGECRSQADGVVR